MDLISNRVVFVWISYLCVVFCLLGAFKIRDRKWACHASLIKQKLIGKRITLPFGSQSRFVMIGKNCKHTPNACSVHCLRSKALSLSDKNKSLLEWFAGCWSVKLFSAARKYIIYEYISVCWAFARWWNNNCNSIRWLRRSYKLR